MSDHILTPLFVFIELTSIQQRVIVFLDMNLVIQTVMSDADNATINCPSLEANQERAQITLHKETELHVTDFQKTQVTNTSMEKLRFSVHVNNDTIDYVIGMPQVNDTGLYNCTVSQHGVAVKTSLTFLFVSGTLLSRPIRSQLTAYSICLNAISLLVKLLSTYCSLGPEFQLCPHERQSAFWLLLAAGCGLMALYSFITTLVSCSFGVSVHIQYMILISYTRQMINMYFSLYLSI